METKMSYKKNKNLHPFTHFFKKFIKKKINISNTKTHYSINDNEITLFSQGT